MIRSRAAAVVMTAFAVLPTAGCFQGFDGTVNDQGPTGNGTDFEVGDSLLVQDATIVAGDSAGDSGSLLLTVINTGEVDDALESVATSPGSSSLADPIPVASGATVRVSPGEDAEITLTGFGVTPGSYATVTFSFADAGQSTQLVAVVPNAGYYEGLAPAGSQPADASPTAEAEPTAEAADGHSG